MEEMNARDYLEYLNYAVSNGIIDVAKLVTDVEMNKRQELLEQHKYHISWILGNVTMKSSS